MDANIAGYRAGAGKSIITPDHIVELSGYGFYNPDDKDPSKRRFAKEGLDSEDLFAKAAKIKYGDQGIVLISADLIGLREKEVRLIRGLVKSYTGIPEKYIMVVATNTHSGPATIPLRLSGEMDPGYMEKLPELVAKSTESIKTYPTDILANRGIIEGVSYNRENHTLDNIDNELFAFFSKPSSITRKPFSVARFSCKPCVLERGNTKFSRDFPGVASDYVEQRLPGEFLFLNGAAGDMRPIIDKKRKGPDHVSGTPYPIGYEELRGEDYVKIGKKIIELREKASPIGPGISASSRTVVLPFDIEAIESGNYRLDRLTKKPESLFYKLWKEDLNKFWGPGKSIPRGVPAEIQAIRFGDYVLVGIPGEVMAETSLQITQKYPNAIVVGFANGQVGYIPTRKKIEKEKYSGVYGPSIFRWEPWGLEVEDVLLNVVYSVIDDVSLK